LEGKYVFVLQWKIPDVRQFDAQGENGQPQVAKPDLEIGFTADFVIDVELQRVIEPSGQ